MRINQYLARCGLGSRRKVEELILGGKIFVNNCRIDSLSTNVSPSKDTVTYLGNEVILPKKYYFILNKPPGYTVTKSDPHAKKNVYELLPNITGLIAVGRLDRDSSGLLIFINDGDFAQSIIHPSNKLEKEYAVSTVKPVSGQDILKLTQGVKVEGQILQAKKIITLGENKYSVVIMEGRKRQIRKMIKSVNNKIINLHRVRIGNILLDIKTGEYRELTPSEIRPYVKN